MISKCEKCNCVFEINILQDDDNEVEYLTCPKCGTSAYNITEDEQIDFTCICCNKIIKMSLESYSKLRGKPCLNCRSILASK